MEYVVLSSEGHWARLPGTGGGGMRRRRREAQFFIFITLPFFEKNGATVPPVSSSAGWFCVPSVRSKVQRKSPSVGKLSTAQHTTSNSQYMTSLP